MEKVKILIVEDELIIANNIADDLEEMGYEPLKPVTNYYKAIESIEANKPDIAILDIKISGAKSGIDIGQLINDQYKFPFIFLSSNTDKITLDQAKHVEPLAYLVKPFNKLELHTSIEVAIYNYAKNRNTEIGKEEVLISESLFLKKKASFVRIKFDDILYLSSDQAYLDIFTTSGAKHTVRNSLNSYMEKLGKQFFRTNRGYAVNLNHIEGINVNEVLVAGHSIPIGKYQKELLVERLNVG